jgi:UDP-N-acetylmuramate--alanine ligase
VVASTRAGSESRPGGAPGASPLHLNGQRCAYLLGIGGAGMSAAAQLLRARGMTVMGSDLQAGSRLDRLRGLGVRVDGGDDPSLLPADLDLLVFSAAIPAEHPQLTEGLRRGLTAWKYADLLGALMADRLAICVAGCHGKTTTTSLVASALVHAGEDPSFVVGGDLRQFGTGARSGRGPHFVAEACEYDRSFHRHRPHVAVVTNVDVDHLDYYRDLAEIQESFRVFASLVPAGGRLVVNEVDAPLFRSDARLAAPVETFGFGEECTWRVGRPEVRRDTMRTAFTLWHEGSSLGRFEVPLLGAHNALNAAAAVAALSAAGLDRDRIADGLASFGGVGRRLEVIARARGVTVLDDYAHHPAEIRAVVRALRRHRDGRVVAVFQPHQASRTRRLLGDFAAALAEADEAWIAPIYYARDREEDRRWVTAADLAAAVDRAGGRATAFPGLDAIVDHAERAARDGDAVVTMGAGNVDEVARGLARRLG